MPLEVKHSDTLLNKQKLCASATRDGLAAVLAAVQKAQAQLAQSTDAPDTSATLSKLWKDVKKRKVTNTVATSTRELHDEVKAFGKVIDEHFEADICLAARKQQLPKASINQVIADHLYRDGDFDVGDTLVREAKLQQQPRKGAYREMHQILKQMQAEDVGPALQWAAQHRANLSSKDVTAFEFQLHTFLFLTTLDTAGVEAALAYARAHFDEFKARHMRDIQQLVCCLLYVATPGGLQSLKASPYAHLLELKILPSAARQFVRLACSLIGKAAVSPLLVSVAAGSVALPQLLKLVKVMGQQSGASPLTQIATCDHLPIEIELGPEFSFHSIFACPVSREQSDQTNAPTMLPCGHVLCLHSVNQLPRVHGNSTFKCPYCPSEASASSCRRLYFPDVE